MAGTTTYIDPTAPSGGDGSIQHPYNSWNQIQPGSAHYLQKAGTTFTGVAYLDLKGTAANPIVVGSYGTGAAPAINGILDFDNGAQYIKASGLSITSPNGPGIALQNGANHIEISNDTISNSAAGIWVGNYAGAGLSIHDNLIQNSTGMGMGIDTTTATAADPTQIFHNTITNSGLDGIEVTTNYAVISANTISGSGLASGGTAGIHLWGGDPASGRGDFNTITGNILLNNHDTRFLDGEGILLDRNVTGNTVTNNLAMGNDSAGIALYDNSGNTIANNTLIGNGMGPSNVHPVKAELWLANDTGQAQNNTYTGNTLIATQPGSFAAFMDGPSEFGNNHFAGNVLEHSGGLLFDVNGMVGAVSTWNSLLGATDRSSGVALSPPGSGSYNYAFPAGTMVQIDGRAVHLAGWSAANGLFGA